MALNSSSNNDYVVSANTFTAPAAWSMSVWFKPKNIAAQALYTDVCVFATSGSLSNQMLFSWDNHSASYSDSWIVEKTGATFAQKQYGSAFPSVGSWGHCAATYDGSSTLTIYNNGASGGTASISSPETGAAVFAGLFGVTTAQSPTGYVSDFAIWNLVLTANEIAGLARGVRPWRVRPSGLITYVPVFGLVSPEADLTPGGAGLKTYTVSGPVYATDPPLSMFMPRRH
jgi:Concanavalin A-like lectin/glucanases superfamily